MNGLESPATLAAFVRTRRILESRNYALERIARGAPLVDVLMLVTRSADEILEDVLSSVLLLDASGCLRHGAAPHLPAAYVAAVEGLPVGPAQGSCGTAAFTGERVVVEDVLTHPYWPRYRAAAIAAGLRACWSEPIRSSKGEILGTFAMYYAEPRAPGPFELDFIRASAHLAGIAIEHARAEVELERHRRRLEELVNERTAELARANAELRAALDEARALRSELARRSAAPKGR